MTWGIQIYDLPVKDFYTYPHVSLCDGVLTVCKVGHMFSAVVLALHAILLTVCGTSHSCSNWIATCLEFASALSCSKCARPVTATLFML